jgi:hypothetical protein
MYFGGLRAGATRGACVAVVPSGDSCELLAREVSSPVQFCLSTTRVLGVRVGSEMKPTGKTDVFADLSAMMKWKWMGGEKHR